VAVTIRVVDKGWKDLVRAFERVKADRPELHVGLLHESGGSLANDRGGKVGPTNALLGVVHEYGRTDGSIPPRPWLVGPFKSLRHFYRNEFADMLRRVFERGKDARDEMGRVGDEIVDRTTANVLAGIPPPNTGATLARKRGSTPLIDYGYMIASIARRVVRGSW
jgi:hypothetical protein